MARTFRCVVLTRKQRNSWVEGTNNTCCCPLQKQRKRCLSRRQTGNPNSSTSNIFCLIFRAMPRAGTNTKNVVSAASHRSPCRTPPPDRRATADVQEKGQARKKEMHSFPNAYIEAKRRSWLAGWLGVASLGLFTFPLTPMRAFS